MKASHPFFSAATHQAGLFWLIAANPFAAPAAQAPVTIEPFIVTGSLIKRTDFEGPSPISVIERIDLERVAGTGLSDVLREIPEATALAIQEHGTVTDTRGVTALDLRSLGPANTLVLVDGRRQAPNGIAAGSTTFVDLNRFPTGMIERIEILKDGAAAVYGADATAGVINIILRKQFSGTEISARYGNYFATDGAEQSWSLLTGGRRGRARAMLGLTWSSRHPTAARDFPFSADADQTEIWRAIDPVKYAAQLRPTIIGTSAFDFRSLSGPYATVAVPALSHLTHPSNRLTVEAIRNHLTGQISTFLPGTGGVPQGTLGTLQNRASVPRETNPGRPTAAQFIPRAYPAGPHSSSFNYQEFVWNTSAVDRRGVNARVGLDLPGQVEFTGALSWVRLETRTEFAPPPISTIADNAILVPAANYYNPFGIPVFFTYRPVDVGPRQVRVQSDSVNLFAGLHGTLPRRLEWDLGWTFSRNESRDTQGNLLESKVREALARTTPDALNVFGGPAFRNAPATLAALKADTTRSGNAETAQADLRITTRELFSLPWGPVGASVSVEHRLERFNITNDELSSVRDDIIGAGRGFGPTRSRRDVQSAAAEARLPLIRERGQPWLHTAELSLAARFERFSDGYDSGIKPFAGLRLRATEHVLLRASYGRVFRAPSLPQLYGGVIDQFSGGGIPDFRRPVALTGDANDGVTSTRLARSGGNPRLRPEDGTTRQIGFVVDVPGRLLAGLSIDFTHGVIRQDDLIRDQLGFDFILRNELGSTGDLVFRQPGTQTFRNTTTAPIAVLSGPAGATTLVQPGDSATVPGPITMILDSAINLADQIVRYDDFGVRYRRALGRAGTFTLRSNWTYYEFYAYRRLPTERRRQVVGQSIPRYRGQSSLAWERGSWSADLGLNYTHRHRDVVVDGWETRRYYTFSAGLGHVFAPGSWLAGTRISVGVENLLDRDPSPSIAQSGAGYDQGFVGRPGGRYWFVAVKRTF